MDFLANAIFREEDQSLYGAMITTFDPKVYTSRAKVHLVTAEEMVKGTEDGSIHPSGFKLTYPGVLLSDTSVRHVLVSDILEYVQEECSLLGVRENDITDLVLLGAVEHGAVFANARECLEDKEEMPILIPFSRFKVSNSAFNIYAPYVVKAGGFRTCSLLDNADGSAKEFYVVFPEFYDMSGFSSGITEVKDFEGLDGLNGSRVYHVDLGLNGFYAGVGEAFLNFLAYYVAYYNVGLEVLTDLSKVQPTTMELNMQKTTGSARRPRCNLSIKHVYNKNTLNQVLDCIGDPDKFLELLKRNPACKFPYMWLQNIERSGWCAEKSEDGKSKTANEKETAYRAACINLKPECQLGLLRYSIELLSHRYQLYQMERSGDSTIGLVLKGGDVGGEALKGILG